ncbi:hypothetical protein [Parapedobacter lycopersici]|uniref:hypothetical protein n=1 Tax=Parapedobacter lycopersici TaxID=1864939 RepID=UPI00333E8B00
MNQLKRLLMLLAIASALACGKEKTAPIPVEVRLKSVTSAAESKQLLETFLTNYPVLTYSSFDDPAYDPYFHHYYLIWSNDQGTGHVTFTSGTINETSKERIIKDERNFLEVSDPRLNAYSNVFVLKFWDNNRKKWIYRLYVHDFSAGKQKSDHIELSCGYYNDYLSYLNPPPPPTDTEAVTALLEFLEPIK